MSGRSLIHVMTVPERSSWPCWIPCEVMTDVAPALGRVNFRSPDRLALAFMVVRSTRSVFSIATRTGCAAGGAAAAARCALDWNWLAATQVAPMSASAATMTVTMMNRRFVRLPVCTVMSFFSVRALLRWSLHCSCSVTFQSRGRFRVGAGFLALACRVIDGCLLRGVSVEADYL